MHACTRLKPLPTCAVRCTHKSLLLGLWALFINLKRFLFALVWKQCIIVNTINVNKLTKPQEDEAMMGYDVDFFNSAMYISDLIRPVVRGGWWELAFPSASYEARLNEAKRIRNNNAYSGTPLIIVEKDGKVFVGEKPTEIAIMQGKCERSDIFNLREIKVGHIFSCREDNLKKWAWECLEKY